MKQILCLLIPLFINSSPMTSGPAVRAVRDFISKQGEEKVVKWYQTEEGFLAEFDSGRYFYDRKGNWRYSILEYGEFGLPEDVRRLVRSTYFDFAISRVQQVNGTQGFAYVVQLDNAKAWKEVIVRDGELVEWKAFDK